MLKRLLILLASLLAVTACQAADGGATEWKAGTHYFPIDPPQAPAAGGKIEVVEVFSYACPHCAHFQPFADELKAKLPKQAQFTYLPAIFHDSWELFARAYYTAEAMGVLDKAHQALFDALHRDRKPLGRLEDIAQFLAGLGVDPKAFLSTAQSFVVNAKLQRSQDLLRAYGIDGTPSIVINGKYRVTAASAGGLAQMVDLSLWLVKRELAASGK